MAPAGEAGLRRKAAIPGVPLDFLRFVQDAPAARLPRDPAGAVPPTSDEAPSAGFRDDRDDSGYGRPDPPAPDEAPPAAGERARSLRGDGSADDEDGATAPGWRPAAGSFDGWPEHLRALKILDPCCGSGHFLVAAFLMLVPMRMAREGLAPRDAVDAVLRDNLYGLELDPRCVEFAAFALALAAWTYPGAEGYRPLPELDVACSGLAPNATKEQWTALAELAASAGGMPPERDLFGAEDTLLSAPLRNSLDALHELFGRAPELGSLIDPLALEADFFQSDFESVRALFAAALERERMSDEQTEYAVAARGMARAAELLAGRYHLVITNVPYLARGRQGEALRAFCRRHYPDAKNDLATVFLERCLELCVEGGAASLVLPQNWLFLTGYRKLREKLLKTRTWHLLARLGEGGFESSAAAGAFVALLTLTRTDPAGHQGGLFDDAPPAGTMYGLDVSESRTAGEKAARLREAETTGVEQARQLGNPDAGIVVDLLFQGVLLEEYAVAPNGMHAGDSWRYRFLYWEVSLDTPSWRYFQAATDGTIHFGGREHVFFWPDDGKIHQENLGARIQGRAAWGRQGIVVRVMRELPVTLYQGDPFDISCVPIVPKSSEHLPPIWCFCSSPEYHDAVRRIDQKLNVTNATLAKVPFDLDRWTEAARRKYPHGLPRPYSDDPTQWIFHGHPCGSVVWDETGKRTAHGPLRTDPTVLQVAVARLSGYRWPAEQDPGMELSDEQREWVRRCEPLHAFADSDGIVCIPPVRGEPSAGERILQLLAAAFGDAWSDRVLTPPAHRGRSPKPRRLAPQPLLRAALRAVPPPPLRLARLGRTQARRLPCTGRLPQAGRGRRQGPPMPGSPHLELSRRLDHPPAGRGEARRSRRGRASDGGVRAAQAPRRHPRRRAAPRLFIRWKPIEAQPVGWEPDANDGVRLNLRPFLAADLPGGRKGAGILRSKPNVHWRKDRGREPFREQERFPWFWRDGKFTGERVNDVHFTIRGKREAPTRTKEKQR